MGESNENLKHVKNTDPYCAQVKEQTVISTGHKHVLAQQKLVQVWQDTLILIEYGNGILLDQDANTFHLEVQLQQEKKLTI